MQSAAAHAGSRRPAPAAASAWPELPFERWRDTHATLQRWLQIVGKIRLAQTAWINHSWHVSLDVTARGLVTPLIRHGTRAFQIELDFIQHCLAVRTSDGAGCSMSLPGRSVADFYRQLMSFLQELRIPVPIHPKPNELADATPFERDEEHASYDRECVERFWRILVQAHGVLEEFRARFRGKSSPVHFFWGNTDLALTRFSGRAAPEHPGGRMHLPDAVLRDAYSHECSECGFWPGGDEHPEPVFYSLAYPMPSGYQRARVAPRGAHYSEELGEFILPYEQVRRSSAPENVILAFLQSTYEAAAGLGAWPRAALEYPDIVRNQPVSKALTS
jgi:hypothetical protein